MGFGWFGLRILLGLLVFECYGLVLITGSMGGGCVLLLLVVLDVLRLVFFVGFGSVVFPAWFGGCCV